MHNFRPLIDLLEQEHPGEFSCKAGKQGLAHGLVIRRDGRDGFAFVFEPTTARDNYLLSLHDKSRDSDPEIWCKPKLPNLLPHIQAWAFPASWMQPAPLDRVAETKRLRKIAEGLAARLIPCEHRNPPASISKLLTEQGKRTLAAAREAVDPRRLVMNFPFDAQGRIELSTSVLLAVCETTKPPARDRVRCFVATSPARRSDTQEIRLELADLILPNQSHRWEKSPWLWTKDSIPSAESLGMSNLKSAANKLALQAVQHLDHGEMEQALALYGITFTADLHRLLGGERIKPPACCAHPDAAWTALMVDTLRRSAPWRLPGALAEEVERLHKWAGEKKGRKITPPLLKFVIFPGQHHQCKACLMLTADVDGRNPRFTIEATAANARLAETIWQRPIAVDFKRFGIAIPEELK